MWQLNNGQVTAQSLSKACSYSMERAYSIKPFYQFRLDFIHQQDMRVIYVLFTGYAYIEQFSLVILRTGVLLPQEEL
jgi:hypothetical protein